MDAESAYRLQAEGQAKKQCQSFQTDRQENQLTQSHQMKYNHPLSRKARSTRYSGHNQAQRD